MEIIVIPFYLGWVIVNCMVAGSKNRSVIGVLFFSIILTPLLPFLYLLAVPVKEKGMPYSSRGLPEQKLRRKKNTVKKCMFCEATMSMQQRKCLKCGAYQ